MATLDSAALEQRLVAALDQSVATMRQSVQGADEGSVDGLNVLIGYLVGAGGFLSATDAIAQVLQSQGLSTLSTRVAALRSEIDQRLLKAQTALALKRNAPQAAVDPLSTPEGVRDFAARVAEAGNRYREMEAQSEAARKSFSGSGDMG